MSSSAIDSSSYCFIQLDIFLNFILQKNNLCFITCIALIHVIKNIFDHLVFVWMALEK